MSKNAPTTTVELRIRTGNAALTEDGAAFEIAAILRDYADQLENGRQFNLDTVYDSNGNGVGTFTALIAR